MKKGAIMHIAAKKLQSDLKKAKEALRLADNIMAYCGGDKWERECTEEDRKKFHKLYEELIGEDSSA